MVYTTSVLPTIRPHSCIGGQGNEHGLGYCAWPWSGRLKLAADVLWLGAGKDAAVCPGGIDLVGDTGCGEPSLSPTCRLDSPVSHYPRVSEVRTFGGIDARCCWRRRVQTFERWNWRHVNNFDRTRTFSKVTGHYSSQFPIESRLLKALRDTE